MKRIRFYLAVAALLAAFGAGAEDNVLRNGDFKHTRKANGGALPLHWNPTGKAAVRIVRDRDRNAVQLPSGESRIHLVQNGLRLTSGRDYVFSIEYRGTPGTKGLFYVERHGHVLALKRFECTDEWQSDSLLVTMPSATARASSATAGASATAGV